MRAALQRAVFALACASGQAIAQTAGPAPAAAAPAPAPASAAAPAASRGDGVVRAIDALMAEAIKRDQLPGASVAVLRGGRLLVAKGYGYADFASETRASAETVYPIGSISKQFTAAGILFLAERERLQLADPVGRYWPQFGALHPTVTVDHLLRHTAGLREFITLPEFAALNRSAAAGSGDRLLGIAAASPLGFAPGSRWSYSNTNYQVLARLIEAINGEPYERFLTEVLFKHAGLTSLRACTTEPAPGEATGYELRGRVFEPAPRENMDLARGDGGLCANAVDLARWARALMKSDVLTPASIATLTRRTQLTDDTVVPYGTGVALLPLEAKRRISHHGAIGGYEGMLTYYVDDDVAIALLTNRAGANIEALEAAIARAVLRLPPLRAANLTVPAATVERLVGPWDIGVAGFPVSVEARDRGQLWLVMPPPGVTAPLQYQGGERFIAVPDAVELRLTRSADGSDRLLLTMAGLPWIGLRGTAAPPPAPLPAAAQAAPQPAAPMSATAPPAAKAVNDPPAPPVVEETAKPGWRGEDRTPPPRPPLQRP